MSKITIQIYEIQDPREAGAVIELGVDRIGSVILSEENWKVSSIKEAIGISRGGGAKHSLIPLFNTKELLFRVIEYYEPDLLHFCESLTHEDGTLMSCEPLVELQICLKEKFPKIEIMRSVPISTLESTTKIPTLDIAKSLEGSSDCFLTDTWLGKEPVDGFIGITGRTSDWSTAKMLVESSSIQVILAGGLSPENVYDAVMNTTPHGVDSCTKTNILDNKGTPVRFQKDLQKVKGFVEEVRRADVDLDGHRTKP